MIIESVGLMIAFLLISTVLLWILIRSKVSIAIKLLLIFVILWYGIVLLNIPANFMGWPKPMTEKDYKGQYIKDYFILESTKEKEGFIYFWLIDQVEVKTKFRFDDRIKPTAIFLIRWISVPRAYSLKYSKDLHKKILKVDKEAKKMPGSLIKIKGNKEGLEDRENDTKIKFEVINPKNVFTKED